MTAMTSTVKNTCQTGVLAEEKMYFGTVDVTSTHVTDVRVGDRVLNFVRL